MHRIQVGGARYGMIKDENLIAAPVLKRERDQNHHAEEDNDEMGFTEEASTIFGFR
jgi:hypothetical protein